MASVSRQDGVTALSGSLGAQCLLMAESCRPGDNLPIIWGRPNPAVTLTAEEF